MEVRLRGSEKGALSEIGKNARQFHSMIGATLTELPIRKTERERAGVSCGFASQPRKRPWRIQPYSQHRNGPAPPLQPTARTAAVEKQPFRRLPDEISPPARRGCDKHRLLHSAWAAYSARKQSTTPFTYQSLFCSESTPSNPACAGFLASGCRRRSGRPTPVRGRSIVASWEPAALTDNAHLESR